MDINHMLEKYNSFDLSIIPDEKDENKYYIVLDGYVVGVQYNF